MIERSCYLRLRTLSILSVTAVFLIAAPITQAKGGKLAKWDSHPGLRDVQTCREAGVCTNYQRVLYRSRDRSDEKLGTLIRQGCSVRHALQGLLSLECPIGLRVPDAREERALRAIDLDTATYISAPSVWSGEYGTTGKGIRVAVLDTGIEAGHPELAGKIFASQNFTNDSDEDVLGHGTHVAGIIAGEGVASVEGTTAHGVAPDVVLYSAKVCGDTGWCLEGDILAGMEWAVASRVQVANMSFGGGAFGDNCDGDTLANKVNWMTTQGVSVVAAAGNNNDGVGTPACASKAIAVGAIDSTGTRAPWSSFGPALDLMAPGISVLSSFSCIAAGTCPAAAYGRMSGTSMSSPHVAGVVALLLQKYPILNSSQIFEILSQSAVDLGPELQDQYYGFGKVDALAALRKAAELYPEIDCQDLDEDGFTSCGGDCNDSNPFVNPDSEEICNGADDNCNGQSDEQCRFEFCGDHICSGAESEKSCPSDCSRKEEKQGKDSNEDKDNSGKKSVVCGDAVCDSKERLSCPRDCGYDFIRSDREDKRLQEVNRESGRGKGNSGKESNAKDRSAKGKNGKGGGKGGGKGKG
ncbi:hypothetical protein COU78_02415 [Candidatus Peregrinibacteria bacterium CG10_big_fil_rev_8_21_14_0_10_49_24]|nr:MAG: hypothetical protein COV83_02395 [Candidatus Peregrinibacteria bacterium CG11_big_fil_rev_8_21_14_0_20_49_14]PIR50991.1 MAG: hypothetical protein COU78_02415 [Candidatus Peregrinibacteria bacterium CG10_big_fil_rev_8_21_14_0_10_49_24]PJA67544.1 MAG: hypothetical protein CO157_03895 [Candidatus Peregrinibacteria bacterium CG_4_9_14_3_um_filter_49_12]